jgi:uncharacterized membrane protein YjdF
VFAIIAGVLYAIAFVLHWAGKGTNPFDATGVFYLGMISLAVHLALVFPWRYHR